LPIPYIFAKMLIEKHILFLGYFYTGSCSASCGTDRYIPPFRRLGIFKI